MRRAVAMMVAAAMVLAGLAWRQSSAAQQTSARKPDVPQQPAGDAVAPRAGETKSRADAPGKSSSRGESSDAARGDAGTVRTLRLPELETDLPEAKGRNTVVVLCGTCHTTRYITIQPPLPRQTWVAEVTKMQKTFGAPIPDDKVPEILDYLVAVRGPRAK